MMVAAGRAVFLDRDGTLIAERHYLQHEEELELLPYAAEAVRMLNQNEWKVVLVTNQSAVARGMLTERDLHRIHGSLEDLLSREGARLDAIYYCPHHPTEGQRRYLKRCRCRKPAPGLLLRASRELDIDLAASYMIGDAPSDIEAGNRAGCRTILVTTGYGGDFSRRLLGEPWNLKSSQRPDVIASSLLSAANWILETEREESTARTG